MLEEVLDFFAGVLGNVVHVLNVVPARVASGNTHHFGVAAAVIGHVKDTDRANGDAHSGKQGVFGEEKKVDGVAI